MATDPILLAKRLGVASDATRAKPRKAASTKFSWDVLLNSPVGMAAGIAVEPIDMAMGAKAAVDEYRAGNPKTAAAIGAASALPFVPAPIARTGFNYISRLARGLKDVAETAADVPAKLDVGSWIKRGKESGRKPAAAEVKALKERVKAVHGDPNKKVGLDEAIAMAEETAPTNMLRTTEQGLPLSRRESQPTMHYDPDIESGRKYGLLTRYAENLDDTSFPGFKSPHWEEQNVHGWAKVFPTGPKHSQINNVSEIQTDAMEDIADAGGPREPRTPTMDDIAQAQVDVDNIRPVLEELDTNYGRMRTMRGRLGYLRMRAQQVASGRGSGVERDMWEELALLRKGYPEMERLLPPSAGQPSPAKIIEIVDQIEPDIQKQTMDAWKLLRTETAKYNRVRAIEYAMPGQTVMVPSPDVPFMTPFLSGEQGASTWMGPVIGGLLAKTAADDARAIRLVSGTNRANISGLTPSTAMKNYDIAAPGLLNDYLDFLRIPEDEVMRRVVTPSDVYTTLDADKMREWGFMGGQLAEAIERAGGVPGFPGGK